MKTWGEFQYYCPHEEDQCSCRKPAIGMFQRALKEFPDIESSIVAGDSEVDVEAAKRLGSQAILIVSDPQTLQTAHQGFAPTVMTASSLLEAVTAHILPACPP